MNLRKIIRDQECHEIDQDKKIEVIVGGQSNFLSMEELEDDL